MNGVTGDVDTIHVNFKNAFSSKDDYVVVGSTNQNAYVNVEYTGSNAGYAKISAFNYSTGIVDPRIAARIIYWHVICLNFAWRNGLVRSDAPGNRGFCRNRFK